MQLTAHVPFDDRVNSRATIDELSTTHMREHLRRTGSKLYDESRNLDAATLARQMNLAEGADEHLFPKNVGLLMFSDDPQRYFKGAQIDIVEFPDGVGAPQFNEKTFHGPIQQQLRDALSYLQTNIIKEKVIKHPDRAEADRVFNYPYDALEEALANAVYHRNYELYEPIEVRVLPDRLEIISYGGADPSLRPNDFEQGVIRIRRYRNRRIGEFLQGIAPHRRPRHRYPDDASHPAANGSPEPKFDTDEGERRYFVTEILIHPAFSEKSDQE